MLTDVKLVTNFINTVNEVQKRELSIDTAGMLRNAAKGVEWNRSNMLSAR